MDTENENIAQTVASLTATGLDEREVNGVPYVIVPEGYDVHSFEDFEKFLPAPKRTKGHSQFISLTSFTDYVNRFKGPGSYINLERSGNATAVINGPTPDKPAWGDHSASFKITYSERWLLWDGCNKRKLEQKVFAEFIEDNTQDFVAPTGGQMLDIARTLEAEQSAKITSAQKDMSSGDYTFSYERTTVAKAGTKGELEIPSRFTIRVPILEGEEAREVELRLRYDLNEGKVTFNYEILQRARLLEEVRRSIFATISNGTGIKPYWV